MLFVGFLLFFLNMVRLLKCNLLFWFSLTHMKGRCWLEIAKTNLWATPWAVHPARKHLETAASPSVTRMLYFETVELSGHHPHTQSPAVNSLPPHPRATPYCSPQEGIRNKLLTCCWISLRCGKDAGCNCAIISSPRVQHFLERWPGAFKCNACSRVGKYETFSWILKGRRKKKPTTCKQQLTISLWRSHVLMGHRLLSSCASISVRKTTWTVEDDFILWQHEDNNAAVWSQNSWDVKNVSPPHLRCKLEIIFRIQYNTIQCLLFKYHFNASFHKLFAWTSEHYP